MAKKPDFESMSSEELLAAYNDLSETKRRAKFPTKAAGVKAVERAWEERHPPRKAKKAEGGQKAPRQSRRADMKLVLKTEENPRRPNTEGFNYFEALRGAETVADYLAKFDDKGPKVARDARIWLRYHQNQGHVELQPAA